MKIKDINRWRSELELAQDFRDKEFGIYDSKTRHKAGEAIDYFENGFSFGFYEPDKYLTTTLNLFHTIAKLIVPTLLFQNPRVMARPNRKIDEDSAPYAREILNYFYRELEIDFENELTVWDGYVLNRGISKVGYSTKYGMDIRDSEAKKASFSAVDKALVAIGLKKPKVQEIIHPEVNYKIIAERPYVKWVSPFKFLMDPRARTIDESMWVCEEFTKTVAELKRNPAYKNVKQLKGNDPQVPKNTSVNIFQSSIEEFRTVDLFEMHYRNDNRMYRQVIAKDFDGHHEELYHDVSIYEIDGFQYDLLEFTRHGHLQFKKSDLIKVRNLQDRFTSTIDAIMEQLDKFVPKIAIDDTALTVDGRKALEQGGVGAIVKCTKNPSEVIKEIGLTQFKSDLKAINDEIINIVTIMTGITKSKLLGLSSAETATGESIAQGGENIRMADMDRTVRSFSKRQTKKLWQIITQFVTLEELELITGESGVDLKTGKPIYNWLSNIDTVMAEKLRVGDYQFDIEVGSTQKVDNALITKRIENLISILGRTDTIALMQQQGKKVDLAEILRLWLLNNPEIVRDVGRIIQDVNDTTQGLIPAQDILLGGRGGMTGGSDLNAARAQEASRVPTSQNIAQEAAQV